MTVERLKEKLLAAKIGGVKQVLIPEENVKDLKEISKEILGGIEVHAMKNADEALRMALMLDDYGDFMQGPNFGELRRVESGPPCSSGIIIPMMPISPRASSVPSG